MGISEHIRRMRVKVACDLLRNTEDRVSDIATEVGISDYNYFTKVFKKAVALLTALQWKDGLKQAVRRFALQFALVHGRTPFPLEFH